jgi:hypothetical protein
MFVAPWLIPPDFLGAVRSGASTGLSLRGQDIQAGEAQDRLGLAYAQMQQNAQQHADAVRQEEENAKAAQALRSAQATALQSYRQSELDNEAKRVALAQQKDAEAQALQSGIQSDTLGFMGAISQPDHSKDTDEFGLPVGGPLDEWALPTALPPPPTASQAIARYPKAAQNQAAMALVRDDLKQKGALANEPEPFDLSSQPVTEVKDPQTGELLGHTTLLGPNRGQFIPLAKPKTDKTLTPAEHLSNITRTASEALKAAGQDQNSPMFSVATNLINQAAQELNSLSPPAKNTPEAKAAKANAIARQHPDWTRQQIINEVNRSE